ncbi:MAG TPA: hypothetical protein VK158_03540 [Acidobacteriota bacterium]|nr:hypothetical protein [Acidobacteriota bacterium]
MIYGILIGSVRQHPPTPNGEFACTIYGGTGGNNISARITPTSIYQAMIMWQWNLTFETQETYDTFIALLRRNTEGWAGICEAKKKTGAIRIKN